MSEGLIHYSKTLYWCVEEALCGAGKDCRVTVEEQEVTCTACQDHPRFPLNLRALLAVRAVQRLQMPGESLESAFRRLVIRVEATRGLKLPKDPAKEKARRMLRNRDQYK